MTWKLCLSENMDNQTSNIIIVNSIEESQKQIKDKGVPILMEFNSSKDSFNLAKWLVTTDLSQKGVFIPEGFFYKISFKNEEQELKIKDLLDPYLRHKKQLFNPI